MPFPSHRPVTRRTFGLAVAATAVGGLAACRSDSPDSAEAGPDATASGTPTSPSTAPGSGAADQGGGRTVQHAMGTTKVPTHPKRVVVLDTPPLDSAIALGVQPVGAVEASGGEGMPGYLGGKARGITIVGTIAEPKLEAIAAVRPDLIISAKVRHEDLYPKLSGIAPTVFSESSGTNWTEGLQVAADALGRQDRADRALAAFRKRARTLGTRLEAGHTTASIVRFLPGEIRLYGPQTFSGTVLSRMGFDLGEHDWDQYSMEVISAEQIERADADVIFATTYGPSGNTDRGSVEKLWRALPAVRNGRQFNVADGLWMLGIGLVGGNLILDDIQRLLT